MAKAKPATIKRKIKYNESHEILRDSGDLYSRWEISRQANSVIVSNNVSKNGFNYPLAHQYGTKTIPARPFLPVDENNELEGELNANIKRVIIDSINKTFKRIYM